MAVDNLNKIGEHMAEKLCAEHNNVINKLKNHLVRGFKSGNPYYYGGAVLALVLLLKRR